MKTVTDSKFNEIADEFDKIKSILVKVSPFLSSLTRRCRIVIDYSVPTAGITNSGVLIINPDFWDTLDFQKRTWVIGHEWTTGRTTSLTCLCLPRVP